MEMDLRYYLFLKRMTQKDFSEKLDISTVALNNYVLKKSEPSLETALDIYFAANGEVDILQMLKPDSFERLNKKYNLQKTVNI